MKKKKDTIKLIEKLLIIFFIGALVGWIYELIFYYFTENRFDNAGVLFGPWLPIYGIGSVFIYFLGTKLKKKPVLLFFAIILITGLLEYVIGYIDLHVFGKKLWDYTGLFLNIDGFVCLRSVLTFGVGGMFLTYVMMPWIENIVNNEKYQKYIKIILSVILIIFISDIFISNIVGRDPYLY